MALRNKGAAMGVGFRYGGEGVIGNSPIGSGQDSVSSIDLHSVHPWLAVNRSL